MPGLSSGIVLAFSSGQATQLTQSLINMFGVSSLNVFFGLGKIAIYFFIVILILEVIEETLDLFVFGKKDEDSRVNITTMTDTFSPTSGKTERVYQDKTIFTKKE